MNEILLFLGGIVALVLGAESLVRGASKLALSFGISPLVVGLTVVAFGTSAPETTVSVSAVLTGQTDIAVGNVVGSNIFNVLFILGVAALIVPLRVDAQVIRQEVPMMIAASALLLLFVLDQQVSLFESVFLFVLLIGYTTFLVVQSRRQSAVVQSEYAAEIKPAEQSAWDAKLPVQIALVLIGLALLIVGSRWLVTAATGFARELGISELVIGLTIVAAGTSLPEVAASVSAALKGERDIAVGNVIGSNLFNIGLCRRCRYCLRSRGSIDRCCRSQLRHLGDVGRGVCLFAYFRQRPRDRTMGRRAVPALLPRLRGVSHPVRAATRSITSVLVGDVVVRGANYHRDFGGIDDSTACGR
jgi:cation:H+ antiporter